MTCPGGDAIRIGWPGRKMSRWPRRRRRRRGGGGGGAIWTGHGRPWNGASHKDACSTIPCPGSSHGARWVCPRALPSRRKAWWQGTALGCTCKGGKQCRETSARSTGCGAKRRPPLRGGGDGVRHVSWSTAPIPRIKPTESSERDAWSTTYCFWKTLSGSTKSPVCRAGCSPSASRRKTWCLSRSMYS